MIQMVYLSFATRRFKMDVDNSIEAILQEARSHNEKNGITGQLIYRAGIFVQFLEGSRDKIEPLLGRILLDQSRHENLKVLFKQELSERLFPDWSMAYKQLDDTALDIVNSIVPWQQLINTSNNGEKISANRILKVFEELKA